MRACDDDKLVEEQERLLQDYLKKYENVKCPKEDLLDYGYAHGSKELIAYFDQRKKQDEWDKKHGCITN